MVAPPVVGVPPVATTVEPLCEAEVPPVGALPPRLTILVLPPVPTGLPEPDPHAATRSEKEVLAIQGRNLLILQVSIFTPSWLSRTWVKLLAVLISGEIRRRKDEL
jgi:hypothetical protein